MESIEYPVLSTTLTVSDASAAIVFYKEAFGAKELFRLTDPSNGKIGHAEITIQGSLLMLADEYPGINKTPEKLGGCTARITLKVDDVDAAYTRAVEAGGEAVRDPSDQFYGHRSGCVRDPFGHDWMLFREVERVSPEEMQRRWDEMVVQSK